MKLEQYLSELRPIAVTGDTEQEITDIASDSRKATVGTLFVAIRGTQTDGHFYIPQALTQGCGAFVVEDLPEEKPEGCCFIQVSDTAEALASLASARYGHPSRHLTLVGVTGTNGKTTVATLLHRLFRKMGYKVGLVSTVCNYVDDLSEPSTHTTPDPLALNALFRRMVDVGCTYAFMEVSSHAAAQKRIGALNFDGGIFTNLTRDHLDYHGSVPEYLRAKKSFFDGLGAQAFALVNADDKNGPIMVQNTKACIRTYALKSMANYRAKIVERHIDGMDMFVDDREVFVRLVGDFNAYNLLCVYGAACELGQDKEEVLRILSELTSVDGRFQTFTAQDGYVVIVDYAHTPDALINVLDTIRPLAKSHKVITVVGAGGNRDKGKRPIMAKEAARRSERLILTSDNPRDEEPQEIIREMAAGLLAEDRKKTLLITDRAEAIRTACMLAEKGDFVLVAGKGHETYQEIKGIKHHFDDREVVCDAVSKDRIVQ